MKIFFVLIIQGHENMSISMRITKNKENMFLSFLSTKTKEE